MFAKLQVLLTDFDGNNSQQHIISFHKMTS